MNIDQAYSILKKYITQESLQKHCIAVSATMNHLAQLNHEDVERWQIVGLLHDIDYEKYPEEHCVKCVEILKSEGVEEDMIHSIQSHGYGLVQNEVEPKLFMEKILYTIDELTGLVIAAALMQPSKKLEDLTLKSLKKKWKSKSFAAKVDRELIAKGAEMAELELDYVLEQTLIALQDAHEELGL